jgi:hypothetical protein
MTENQQNCKGVPEKIRMFSNGRTAEFDFAPDMETASAWRWVLEMADGIDPYLPVRVGRNIHLISVPSIKWGSA